MINKLSKKFRKKWWLLLPGTFLVFVVLAIVLGDIVFAADIQTQFQVPFGDVQTGSVTTMAQYINAVYKYMVAAAGVLAGFMFAIGGFMYISSGGDSGRVSQGKKYIVNALLGLVLLVSSYVLLNTINPNATELQDVGVAAVKGETFKRIYLGCPCDSDADCGEGGTYYCETRPTPHAYPYMESDAVALKNLALTVTKVTIGAMAVGAVIAVGAGGLIITTAAKVKTAAVATTKFVAKQAAKHYGVLLLVGIGYAAYSYLKDANLDSFDLSGCKKIENPNGICLANISKYLLQPAYWGDTGCSGSLCGPLLIYKDDGTIPPRSRYFTSEKHLVKYIDPISGQLTEATFGYLDNTVNGDLCSVSHNRCPCIQWVAGKELIECARQARCVRVYFSDISRSNALFTVINNHYISLCLTGSEKEACIDNNDCQIGLSCVDIKDKDNDVRFRYSTLRQSLAFLQGKSDFESSSVGTLSGGLDRDRVCLKVDAKGNALLSGGDTDVCGSDNDCKKGSKCVAIISGNKYANVCIPSNADDYFTIPSEIDKLCIYDSGLVGKIINDKVCSIADFKENKISGCTEAYSSLKTALKEKQTAFNNSGCKQVVINRVDNRNDGRSFDPSSLFLKVLTVMTLSGTVVDTDGKENVYVKKPSNVNECFNYYKNLSSSKKTEIINKLETKYNACFTTKTNLAFNKSECSNFILTNNVDNVSPSIITTATATAVFNLVGSNVFSNIKNAITFDYLSNYKYRLGECYLKYDDQELSSGDVSYSIKGYINLSKINYNLLEKYIDSNYQYVGAAPFSAEKDLDYFWIEYTTP